MARRARETIALANAAARSALNAERIGGIGSLGWYDLTPGFTCAASTVHAALTAAGLDPASTLPLPPDHASAFGRAVEHVRGVISVDSFTLKEAAKGANGERRTAIVSEARNGKYTALDVGTIACPASTVGSAPYIERTDTPMAATIAARVLDAQRAMVDVYTTDDLRIGVVAMIDRWGGMSCRRQAPHVVYWIPGSGEAIARLSDAIESIGAGRLEMYAGDASNPRTVKAATQTVNAGLEARLSDFATQADAYIAGTTTRESTLQSMLEESKRIREQAALYRAILGAAVAGVDDRIAKVDAKIRDRLMSGASASA